jgi:hypothetical protein
VTTALGADAQGVEQEIVLSDEALEALRGATEAFVVFDLRVPRGDLSGLRLEVGGRPLPASALVPTMPRLRESTMTGGRDWRGYPQWWALPLDPSLLPRGAAEPLRVVLRHVQGSPVVLGGDRFKDQARVYEGPSFGDWPHFAALKLEYDGDYRLPARLPLSSGATRSYSLGPQGQRSLLRWVHRIRVLTLGSSEGSLLWESAPLPAAPGPRRVALGFSAYSGKRGRAEIDAGGRRVLAFPLGSEADFDVEEGADRLCYRAEAPRQDKAYGHYFLLGSFGNGGEAVPLSVRFRTGMTLDPLFFVIDRKSDRGTRAAAYARCSPSPGVPLVDGAGRILDATKNNYPEDTGRWYASAVY